MEAASDGRAASGRTHGDAGGRNGDGQPRGRGGSRDLLRVSRGDGSTSRARCRHTSCVRLHAGAPSRSAPCLGTSASCGYSEGDQRCKQLPRRRSASGDGMAAATTGGAFNGQGGTYDKRPLAQFQQGGATPGGAYPVRGTSAGNRDGCTLQDTSFQAGSQRAFATTCSALYDDATSERSALQSAAAFMPSSVQKPSERKLGLPSCLDRTGACGRTGRGGGEGGGGSLPAAAGGGGGSLPEVAAAAKPSVKRRPAVRVAATRPPRAAPIG